MVDEPTTKDGYPPELAIEARRMCLYVATVLGDLLDDIVIVGGLVPYLIVDQQDTERETHIGTRDLDLGLSLVLLGEGRYQEMASRLRTADFLPDKTTDGKTTRQRWRLKDELITIDFLIAPAAAHQRGGSLQNLEGDFAAIVNTALPVAFLDFIYVEIDDVTPKGDRAQRTVRVCGPAAFVVLKAHAIDGRRKNKDAYDLVYVLQFYGAKLVTSVVERYPLVADHPAAKGALGLLERDFASVGHTGPRRRAEFLGDVDDPDLCQDAFGIVRQFLAEVARAGNPVP